jgi:hypothetical protein
LLERIAKDPQAFIRQQGWASVSLDGDHTLMELRSLYEHLQARILELIEPSSLKLRRAEDAPETVCGETPQPRGAGIGGRGAVLDPGDQAAGCTSMSMRWPSSIRTRCIS